MKILICTDTFRPGTGGTEEACVGYATALASAGNEVMLACPNYHRETDDSKYNFKVVRLASVKLTKNDCGVLLCLSGKQIKLMREFAPDIIHIESISAMAKIGLKLAKQLGVPAVMTVHTKFRSAFERSAGKLIASCLIKTAGKRLNSADKVITVADCMIDEIKSYGYKGDVTVIKNGAGFDKVKLSKTQKAGVKSELGFKKDEKLVLFVGLMIEYKRVEFLIRAFSHAAESGFDGKLLLMGDGPDRAKFEEVAKKLGLSDRVVFLGRVTDREKVRKYYEASDLFVIASIFDNDPLVVVEAACCSVPSIAIKNTGASNRIVNGVNGFTADDDIEKFGDKIAEVMKMNLDSICDSARETVPTTWQETVNKHLPIYEKLIESKREKIAGENKK